MANPSQFSMFIRLVGGNEAAPYPGLLSPDRDESKLSAHDFFSAMQMWANGEITKDAFITQYNLTHTDDSADLDNFREWFLMARNREHYANVLESRIILARDKENNDGSINLNGVFGYAIKSKLLGGADEAHPLSDLLYDTRPTGPPVP